MNKPIVALLARGLSGLRTPIAGLAVAAMIGAAVPSAADAATSAAIVVDAKTGKVLYSSNPDARAYPASLTKMMTLYMVFEALETGQLKLDSRLKISAQSAAQPPSKLGLKAGSTIAVKDAILALVTRSANDIACAIGENLGGTERGFALKMTAKARALGMKNTTFRNASGLPDSAQVTTARDMAILGRALREHFPTQFAYFKTRSFTYGGAKIANHNRLLGRVEGVDGIKTGYTRASGFNLVSSMSSGNRRVVAVVLGGSSGKSRDDRMAQLLKAHLPKASTGRQTAQIARPAADTFATVPRGTTLIASAAPPATRTDAAAAAPMSTAAISVPYDVAGAQGDIEEDDVPAAPAKAAASVSGWKIQIAATPTREAALTLLDRAKAGAGSVLGKASAYTEPVVKDKVTLYRARFAGFSGKAAASAACAYLVKRDFACLALSE